MISKYYIFDSKFNKMLIERTNNDKITITLSSSIDKFGLSKLVGYAKYLEATARSKAKQSDADKLAEEVNAVMFRRNKKFLSK